MSWEKYCIAVSIRVDEQVNCITHCSIRSPCEMIYVRMQFAPTGFAVDSREYIRMGLIVNYYYHQRKLQE